MAFEQTDRHNYGNRFNQAIWLEECRKNIRAYVISRDVVCQKIPLAPLWAESPFTSVWVIKGVGIPGFDGWYAIAGDHPTDLVGLGNLGSPADVLNYFSEKWTASAETLMQGKPVGDFRIPQGADLERYGAVIADRASKLAVIVKRLRDRG